MSYNACDGKPTEQEALERKTYLGFCLFIDKYLEKVKEHNKQIERLKSKNNG